MAGDGRAASSIAGAEKVGRGGGGPHGGGRRGGEGEAGARPTLTHTILRRPCRAWRKANSSTTATPPWRTASRCEEWGAGVGGRRGPRSRARRKRTPALAVPGGAEDTLRPCAARGCQGGAASPPRPWHRPRRRRRPPSSPPDRAQAHQQAADAGRKGGSTARAGEATVWGGGRPRRAPYASQGGGWRFPAPAATLHRRLAIPGPERGRAEGRPAPPTPPTAQAPTCPYPSLSPPLPCRSCTATWTTPPARRSCAGPPTCACAPTGSRCRTRRRKWLSSNLFRRACPRPRSRRPSTATT